MSNQPIGSLVRVAISMPAPWSPANPAWMAKAARCLAERIALLALPAIVPVSAKAEPVAWGASDPSSVGIAGTITLQTNQTFRGETISRDSPGTTLAISADGPLGLFAGADVSLALNAGEVLMTANSQYAGIAVRLGRTSLELGGIHRRYHTVVDTEYAPDYSEIFLGLAHGTTRLRGYLSRDYNVDHKLTGYVELEARLLQVGPWSLNGHGGLTFVPHDPGTNASGPKIYEDWSLYAGREWRGLNLGLAVSSSNYPVIGETGSARVSVSVSKSF